MQNNGILLLAACAALSVVGCEKAERRPGNEPAPAMTIVEEPVTIQHEPDRSPTVESSGNTSPLEMPSATNSNRNVRVETAPVQTATPANNPPPAPLRPRSDVVPMPCSDDSSLADVVIHGGKTCIMEIILDEHYTVRGARLVDGRFFTFDPQTSRLHQVADVTQHDKPWYAVSRAELERDVFPVIAIGMGILFLVLLARAIVRSRRDNHQWPWGYQDRPINRDRISDHTPPSHNHRGGLTEQEFRALSRAEQIRLERAMVDIEIESARGAAQFAHQRRRNTLDLELVRFREQRKLIEASVQAEISQIDAATETELARLSAERAGYEADEEETTGVYFDVEGAFEEHEGETGSDNENDDPNELEQSGFGEDDDIDPDGNV